jgi:predicted metal-dependent hydrolase
LTQSAESTQLADLTRPAPAEMLRSVDRKTRDELMAQLNRDAIVIASHFGLRYRAIEAERANVKSRYGICYSDGTIKIRLRHATTGKPLKYSSLVATLCHELAHLRYFNHGPRFREFNRVVLEFARERRIYRPRSAPQPPEPRAAVPLKPRAPRQLTLFPLA